MRPTHILRPNGVMTKKWDGSTPHSIHFDAGGSPQLAGISLILSLHDLIELMTHWLADLQKIDSATLARLMKMGAKVAKLLEVKDKVKDKLTGKTRS